MAAASAFARRTFADARIRAGSFALLFAFVAFASPIGYRHSYPTVADRLAFARTFGANTTVQLFYGVPHDLLTVGGYTAWRVSGLTSVFAGFWGLLAAVRALRAEEDSGRQEIVLSGVLGRRAAYVAALAAIVGGAAILWLALLAALAGANLSIGGSAYLALATVSPVPVFVGVGALASQLAATRRLAVELAAAALAVAFTLRVVADTAAGFGWLRWATPFGWVEQLRPFAHPDLAVLLLPAGTGVLLIAVAGAIAVRRDVGSGLLRSRDSESPRLHLLSSPVSLAFREELGTLAGWLAGTGAFALVVGALSTSFTNANVPAQLRAELRKLGGVTLTTPAGALGFYFLFFVLVTSLFACSQIAAAHREEADQRLETLFAEPRRRDSWLAGRLALAVGGEAAIALTAGALAWVGAKLAGADISLARMLEAGANCLPVALLFLALGALAFALLPRASAGIAYGLVSIAFVWQLLGSVLGAPRWLIGLSPFQHVALVPAQPFRALPAVTMLVVGAAVAGIAVQLFCRRDLTGA